MSKLQPGERWLEKSSNRVIVILKTEVHGTGPSWCYEDGGTPGVVNWHYCDVADFSIWKTFEYLPDTEKSS